MTGRIRATNPQGRREYVDAVTGARTRAGVAGSRRSGRLIARVRPRSDAPFEVVTVDPEDLDPARDTFGIDPATNKSLRERARAQARGREPKPMRRDAELDLGRAGATTTFASGRAAADTFMRNNAAFFDNPLFEATDFLDATRDFMDRLEVRSGKGHARLVDTPRGVEILEGGGRGHAAVARDMLTYLMGQAGRGRRWRDVPWALVDGYVDALARAMQEEAKRQGRPAPASGIEWYPLSSGVYQPDEVVALAVDELGEAKARRLAAWLNSQSLYELADRLEHVLKPLKGAKGKQARRARKCLSKDDKATVRRRIREIRDWAAYPDTVPTWACVATRETETTSVPVCMFPALEDEVRRLLGACDVPYDPNWPEREHARLCASGDTDTSGLPPQPCPGDHDEDEIEDVVVEDLDLPWENPERNPPRRIWIDHGQLIEYTTVTGPGPDYVVYDGPSLVYPVFQFNGEPMTGSYRGIGAIHDDGTIVMGDPWKDVNLVEGRVASEATKASLDTYHGFRQGLADKRKIKTLTPKHKHYDKSSDWWFGYNDAWKAKRPSKKNPNTDISDFDRERIEGWRSDAMRMMAGERIRGQTGRAGVERLADRASAYAASISVGRPFGSPVTDPRVKAYGTLSHDLRSMASRTKNPASGSTPARVDMIGRRLGRL